MTTYLKKCALYGGLDHNDFDRVEFRLWRRNRRIWTIASIFCAILFLVEFIVSFFAKSFSQSRYLYLGIGIFFLVGCLLLLFVLKKESIFERIWIQLSLLTVFAFAIILGNLGSEEEYAVTIMVMLVALPISITTRPYRMVLLILTAGISEIICVSIMKSGGYRIMDIYDSLIFMVVSLVLNYCLTKEKIKAFSNESTLRRMAYVDSLTGMGNEYSYIEKRELIERKIEASEKTEFGVAMFDLNNLKKTNDTYGHAYGCNLVVQCGKYIKSLFETSQSFHIGGDEYLVIIEKDDLEKISTIFAKYDKDMEGFYVTKNDLTLRLTCARGYAVYNALEDKSFEDVLQKADNLMYQNKKIIKEKMNQ